MNTLKQWRNNAMQLAEAHESVLTCLLLGAAAVLVLIAIYGKTHHKAIALLYIAL